MTPSTWPRALHAECIADRCERGERPGTAEVAAVLDVVEIARLLHPTLSLPASLAVLAADEQPDGRRGVELRDAADDVDQHA